MLKSDGIQSEIIVYLGDSRRKYELLRFENKLMELDYADFPFLELVIDENISLTEMFNRNNDNFFIQAQE